MIVQMLFAIFAVLTIEEFEIRITLMMRYWMFLVVVRRRWGIIMTGVETSTSSILK
jgi:hypothetical protein